MAAKVSVSFGKLSDTGLDNFVQGVNAALTAVAGGFSLARARLGSRFGFLRFENTRGNRRCMSGLYGMVPYNT